MGKKEGTPLRYSYEILPIPSLTSDVIKRLDPWAVLEFFRIEALLRSDLVRKLYDEFITSLIKEGLITKTLKPQPKISDIEFLILGRDPLAQNYYVSGGFYEILHGAHRIYLDPNYADKLNKHRVTKPRLKWQSQWWVYPGSSILYLENTYQAGKGFSHLYDEETQKSFEDLILKKHPRYLWARLDAAFPPSAILNELRKELTKRHKKFNEISPFSPSRTRKGKRRGQYYTHPTKQPPIRDFTTWVNYFRCYDLSDLRDGEGKTDGQIAAEVYGDSNKRDSAKKGYDRVSILIHYAETHNWPPPANFLNPK